MIERNKLYPESNDFQRRGEAPTRSGDGEVSEAVIKKTRPVYMGFFILLLGFQSLLFWSNLKSVSRHHCQHDMGDPTGISSHVYDTLRSLSGV